MYFDVTQIGLYKRKHMYLTLRPFLLLLTVSRETTNLLVCIPTTTKCIKTDLLIVTRRAETCSKNKS